MRDGGKGRERRKILRIRALHYVARVNNNRFAWKEELRNRKKKKKKKKTVTPS